MTTESHNNSKKRQQVRTGKIEEGGKVEFPRVATKSGLIGHGIYIECIIKYQSLCWMELVNDFMKLGEKGS